MCGRRTSKRRISFNTSSTVGKPGMMDARGSDQEVELDDDDDDDDDEEGSDDISAQRGRSRCAQVPK